MGNGSWETIEEHKSLEMRVDARVKEILTAITDERQPPGGPPMEGLHLLVSVVDSLRVGSPAKPPGVRLYFLCCLDFVSFSLCCPAFFYLVGLLLLSFFLFNLCTALPTMS